MASENPGGLAKDAKFGMLAPYDSWANRRAIYEFVKDIPTKATHPTWRRLEAIEESTTLLKDIPVKLIWGMKDWCFRPECMDRIKELVPHAEVCEMQFAGHYVVEDEPEKVLHEVKTFLKQIDSRS